MYVELPFWGDVELPARTVPPVILHSAADASSAVASGRLPLAATAHERAVHGDAGFVVAVVVADRCHKVGLLQQRHGKDDAEEAQHDGVAHYGIMRALHKRPRREAKG